MSSDEITVTLTSLTNQNTESINVSKTSTTINELCEFAVALLGLGTSDNLSLNKNGQNIYINDNNEAKGSQLISSIGIGDGDLIIVMEKTKKHPTSHAPAARAPAPAPAAGGLDFSALLGNTAAATKPKSQPKPTGGLTFNLPPVQLPMFSQKTPVQWEKMTLDDAIERNTNPDCFISVLLSPNHPNLLKELNYHSPMLANQIKQAKSHAEAANIWRSQMQKATMNSTLSKTLLSNKRAEMEKRLELNPMDEEANAYIMEQIRKENVDAQYRQMMNEFPESMGRVLMLYIDAEVNGHAIQAFVDSGAQSTIMSSKCAERCGLSHLIDTRFEGTAVGVGTGKILGRVHIAEMKIKGFEQNVLPCTITIMDSEQGLGDKNMDFLLGLDMLKRHRCNIDLSRNVLQFGTGTNSFSTPFLHEKDLSEAKGGTQGFDADKSNKELEELMEEQEKKLSGDEKDGDGDETMQG